VGARIRETQNQLEEHLISLRDLRMRIYEGGSILAEEFLIGEDWLSLLVFEVQSVDKRMLFYKECYRTGSEDHSDERRQLEAAEARSQIKLFELVLRLLRRGGAATGEIHVAQSLLQFWETKMMEIGA